MEYWFSELQTPNVKLSIRVDRQLYSGRSEFQRIDIFDSPEFGRFLTLDGYMMLTEKDEFIYHEMITHVPMAVHPCVKKVLVIGAGDGGVIRELTRYPEIEQIDLVEIDQLVVEVCKKYRGNIEKVYHKYITERLSAQPVDPNYIFITTSNQPSPELAQQLENTVRAAVPDVKEVLFTRTGCTVTSHCGPGTLGVLFLEK